LSATESLGKICRPCGTSAMPWRARRLAAREVIFRSSRWIEPPSARRIPMITFSSVVLPTPLRPITQVTRPGDIVAEIPCRVWMVP
jgi:hypothetical protein